MGKLDFRWPCRSSAVKPDEVVSPLDLCNHNNKQQDDSDRCRNCHDGRSNSRSGEAGWYGNRVRDSTEPETCFRFRPTQYRCSEHQPRLRFSGKASDSRQRLICRNPKSGLFRFSKDTKVKQFLIESPTFSTTLRNFRVPNSANDGTWRWRRRTISPVKLVRPEASFPRPKTICDTAPKGVKGSVRFLSNPIPECTQRNDAGITKRCEHRRDRFADHG